jgi:hypothetical protein
VRDTAGGAVREAEPATGHAVERGFKDLVALFAGFEVQQVRDLVAGYQAR